MSPSTAKIIIAAGLLLVIVGLIAYFFGDKFHWIGRLPGDIRIEKEHFRFYFPITTMILASVLVSVLLRILNKLF
ncbi:DUF2905 domain-containing protein [Flavihumibacter rivuli]|uniref:DUF2905 domain-containing protein n=1 Tax=Flavihumibacter rivuli TaxID=2838156 RepID=UPI001BDECC67|nr:DUF2905 domain-containing protein [Flavihumibacter rivuli]ULQ55401.1 DUF2905 domain-containing protein [Flavihumibacter rivuli]